MNDQCPNEEPKRVTKPGIRYYSAQFTPQPNRNKDGCAGG
jgi:hypothetical protein